MLSYLSTRRLTYCCQLDFSFLCLKRKEHSFWSASARLVHRLLKRVCCCCCSSSKLNAELRQRDTAPHFLGAIRHLAGTWPYVVSHASAVSGSILTGGFLHSLAELRTALWLRVVRMCPCKRLCCRTAARNTSCVCVCCRRGFEQCAWNQWQLFLPTDHC